MRCRPIAWCVFLSLAGLGYLLSQPHWLFAAVARGYPGALYSAEDNKFVGDRAGAAEKAAPNHSEVGSPNRRDRGSDFPVVALTIDDGPGPNTEKILALLERHGAKATFFNISDHLPGYESVVSQTVAAGHELGNHLSKDEPSIRLSPDEFEADLLAAESALLPFVGKSSDTAAGLRWMRPGMGLYTSEMVAIAHKHNYRLALGNNFPYDTHVPSARFARAFILAKVKSGDIIVLHDGQGKHSARGDRTYETLRTVLPVLRNRGYKITTLSDLTVSAE